MTVSIRGGLVAILVGFILALAPATAADARTSTSRCPIAQWNTAAGVSGGCTCHVAQRIGVPIPWSGNAGEWWAKATWPKSSDEPRVGSIAAFAYGHVSYIERVALVTTARSAPINVQVITGYRKELRWSGPLPYWISVPVYRSTSVVRVTETHDVAASNRSYYNEERGVFETRWSAQRAYSVMDGGTSNVRWTTSRTGSGAGLQGYIYRP